MKKKCPYCDALNKKRECGYYYCSNCSRWYKPLNEKPESKGDLREFLDSEEGE